MLPIIDVICFIILGVIIGVFVYYSRCLTLCIKEYKQESKNLEKIKEAYKEKNNDFEEVVRYLSQAREEKNDLINQISNLTNQLKNSQNEAYSAYEKYIDLLDADYCEAEEKHRAKLDELEINLQSRKEEAILEYDANIEKLQEQWREKIKNLEDLMSTIDAANESIRKAELDEKQRAAYQLYISEEDLSDVKKLLDLCNNFKNPRALRMIVWSSYFQKETNNLCTRVKANNVTGIYKITNLLNNKVYVGQAKSISDRWKSHIKCGLGIDTPVTNSLYKAMLHDGVWNFTFEILEECPQEQLNECERKWIALFSSDEIGYNGNKGVSK